MGALLMPTFLHFFLNFFAFLMYNGLVYGKGHMNGSIKWITKSYLPVVGVYMMYEKFGNKNHS